MKIIIRTINKNGKVVKVDTRYYTEHITPKMYDTLIGK